MDIKNLYIKTQINIRRWSLAVSAAFFGLALLPFVLKNYTTTAPTYSIWVNLFAYGAIFGLQLVSLLKVQAKAALGSFYITVALSTFYMLNILFGLKKYFEISALNQSPVSNVFFWISILSTASVMFGISFLYYKNYSATKKLIEIKDEVNS